MREATSEQTRLLCKVKKNVRREKKRKEKEDNILFIASL
jgi:hypothetical protein